MAHFEGSVCCCERKTKASRFNFYLRIAKSLPHVPAKNLVKIPSRFPSASRYKRAPPLETGEGATPPSPVLQWCAPILSVFQKRFLRFEFFGPCLGDGADEKNLKLVPVRFFVAPWQAWKRLGAFLIMSKVQNRERVGGLACIETA